MTVVLGTAGHIDHGKTALLRALTGIDADRLPEERRRGMTIDVGYAHLDLDDGTSIDFVDVPGHERLVGNMLVGAGEIDAAILVVAADDGPRAQTFEHLDLLAAMGIVDGLAVVTKTDVVDAGRVGEVRGLVRDVLAARWQSSIDVLAVSSLIGDGLDGLRRAIVDLRDRVVRQPTPGGGARLAIDRVFGVRGRGTVVTGTLRGGPVAAGDTLVVVPGGRRVRVREVQVHGQSVARSTGGRTALNVVGEGASELRRGLVISADPAVSGTARLLAVVPAGLRMPADLRIHAGTEAVEAVVSRGRRENVDLGDGRRAVVLRLAHEIAAAPGDRFALRRPSPVETIGGGVVLDADPPRGAAIRRATPGRLRALADADVAGRTVARLELHGALPVPNGSTELAPDVLAALDEAATTAVRAYHDAEPASAGMPIAELRAELVRTLRRLVTLSPVAAGPMVDASIDRLVAGGKLARDGDRLADPDRAPGRPSALEAAMTRLEHSLAVAAPLPLSEAARAAGCPPEGLRALETAGRIVRVDPDLAWASATYRELEATAVDLARSGPLTPAALRDATGTTRRFVMPLLDDLNRRGVLRRTAEGHVVGPRAPVRTP